MKEGAVVSFNGFESAADHVNARLDSYQRQGHSNLLREGQVHSRLDEAVLLIDERWSDALERHRPMAGGLSPLPRQRFRAARGLAIGNTDPRTQRLLRRLAAPPVAAVDHEIDADDYVPLLVAHRRRVIDETAGGKPALFKAQARTAAARRLDAALAAVTVLVDALDGHHPELSAIARSALWPTTAS